jgi:hypothetical protein
MCSVDMADKLCTPVAWILVGTVIVYSSAILSVTLSVKTIGLGNAFSVLETGTETCVKCRVRLSSEIIRYNFEHFGGFHAHLLQTLT